MPTEEDAQLLAELKLIEAGDVTDATRVRQAFALADEWFKTAFDELYAQEDVLERAKDAFLTGWPGRPLRVSA